MVQYLYTWLLMVLRTCYIEDAVFFYDRSPRMNHEAIARRFLRESVLSNTSFSPVVREFVQHHQHALSPEFWIAKCGNPEPLITQILDQLELRTAPTSQQLPHLFEEDLKAKSANPSLNFYIPNDVCETELCISIQNNQVIDVRHLRHSL